MKKIVLIFIALVGISNAQNGDHIHHLFGLKESVPGIFTQSALNQDSGSEVEIETFNMSFVLGGAYAFRTVNNRVLYIDTSGQTISLINNYLLPEIYESGYAGLSGTPSTLQGSAIDICLDPLSDSLAYAFDFFQKTVTSFSTTGGGSFASSTQLNDFADATSLNMAYFNSQIFVSGKNANNNTTLMVLEEGTLVTLDTYSFSSEYIYLVAHPTLGVYGIAQDNQAQNTLVRFDDPSGQFIIIDTLPSCDICALETFTYDKNALVLDPENEEIIFARTEEIAGNTSNYLSTYSLITGEEVYNIQTTDRWSNLIFQKPQDDLVYPGDANHDKVVDILDVLPIGLRYIDTVPQRLEISTDWIGQLATNSGDTVFGVDKKHADCNGDGQINAVDLNAINNNYDYVHYSEKSTNAACDFPLYINFPSLVKEDENFEVEIGLDMSADLFQDVYGVVFTVEFDSGFVVQNTINTSGINGGWFGTENSDYFQVNYVDYPVGKMDVGVVGIDKLNRNGGGTLLNGIWTMEDVVIPIAQGYIDMPIKISNVTIIDFNENVIDACGLDTTIKVYDKNVGVKNRTTAILDIHPNPTRTNAINLEHVESLDYVEIYDLQGRLLDTWNKNFARLNIAEYNKGVYIVKAYAGEITYVNKLVFDKE